MNVLITGGAGFIGSHLVEHYLLRGDHVWAVDNLDTGSLDNLKDHQNFRFDQAPLQEFLQVADMVKFACHSPSLDEADAAIDKARKFIHDTANDEPASVKEQVAA